MFLRIHPLNPRYFQDADGRPVYLTGSHHWDVLQESGQRPGGFDFEGYLDRLASWGHNFIRFWAHEAWTHEIHPRPWPRLLNGRFDLTRFDPEYFARLRERAVRAGERGFYVGVMLFNGWSIHSKGFGNPWDHHPFNRLNNVNGIDGDPDARGEGSDVHTLRVPAVTRLQEIYMEKVVETVGDLDHVLWEISNESPRASLDWQFHMARRLREIDGGRHPIGVTATFPGNRNEDLFASPADWISPGNKGGWRRSPPPADGSRVVLVDTDHLWGIGGDAGWIWKVFLRGHHPIYMDPLDDDPIREGARRAMGYTLRFSRRIDLAACVPDPKVYALVNRTPEREEVLGWLPGGRGKIDLTWLQGELRAEWFDPRNGATADGGRLAGGKARRVTAPWSGDAVLLATRARDYCS
ncbi:MAG TPA: DUF4038 domain-containing protein [Thermoanaerobaculia bacterium]